MVSQTSDCRRASMIYNSRNLHGVLDLCSDAAPFSNLQQQKFAWCLRRRNTFRYVVRIYNSRNLHGVLDDLVFKHLISDHLQQQKFAWCLRPPGIATIKRHCNLQQQKFAWCLRQCQQSWGGLIIYNSRNLHGVLDLTRSRVSW